jgi:regulatory protein
LLARREHSRTELSRKLKSKGFESGCIEDVLQELANEGLQSDQRYIESFLSSRINKGYGPVRLAMELRERGIDGDLIEASIQRLDIDWMDTLLSVRQKKFGEKLPANYNAQAKESRFLQYRGFTMEQIKQLYKRDYS